MGSGEADASPPQIRVLVVDDHALVRDSLRRALGAEPDLDAVGTTGTLAGAAELIHTLRPDVVLLDQSLPPGADKYAEVDVDLLARLAAGATLRDAALARDLADEQVHALVARAADALGGRSTLETLTRAAAAGLLVAS